MTLMFRPSLGTMVIATLVMAGVGTALTWCANQFDEEEFILTAVVAGCTFAFVAGNTVTMYGIRSLPYVSKAVWGLVTMIGDRIYGYKQSYDRRYKDGLTNRGPGCFLGRKKTHAHT